MPWWIVALPLPYSLDAAAAEVLPPAAETIPGRADGPGPATDCLVAAPAGEAEPAASETPGRFEFVGLLTWRSWLVLAWLGGIAWQIGRMLVQRVRLTRLLRRARAATDPHLLAVVEQVAGQLGLARRPAVVLTEEGGGPVVCGLLHPVLVLPRGLMAEIDPEHWHAIVLHELGHLKRRDLWWAWLPAVARLVYFFHPVAHWVHFRIRLERELACDQLAMTLSGRGPARYAEVLVQIVSHASLPRALTVSPAQGLSTFWKRRLTMLLSTSPTALSGRRTASRSS